MIYKALDISKYIIIRSCQFGAPVNHTKLQKVLYFIQAEFLVLKDEPCFEERIEAWKDGPIIPKVYYKYQLYGRTILPDVYKVKYCLFDKRDRDAADGIIKECVKYSTDGLIEISRKQSPWKTAYAKGAKSIISNESIKDFFKS